MMKSEISTYLCTVQSCQELERYICKYSFFLLFAHNQVEDEEAAAVRSCSPMMHVSRPFSEPVCPPTPVTYKVAYHNDII